MIDNRTQYLKDKMQELVTFLKAQGSVLVALSGGVDSSLLAYLAKTALNTKSLAVTANSPTLPPGELQAAISVAEEIGIRHKVITINELENEDFTRNPSNRCYFCKKDLAKHLKQIAMMEGIEAVVMGVVADDLKEHRPGIQALKEENVLNPLVTVGLRKNDVRDLCRMLGLSVADKPSMACLSSRVAYGEEITSEKLLRIGAAERFIKQYLGIRQLRVRVHGPLARIEASREERKRFFDEDILDTITSELRGLGFLYVTLDLSGYRSGSMNEPLGLTKLNPRDTRRNQARAVAHDQKTLNVN